MLASSIGRLLLTVRRPPERHNSYREGIEVKPYAGERWLYVDEVDVDVDQRRKGADSAIIEKLFEIGREAGCIEVRLVTEVENDAASGVYGNLAPTERETCVGYAWSL